jgi:hypothetical protein
MTEPLNITEADIGSVFETRDGAVVTVRAFAPELTKPVIVTETFFQKVYAVFSNGSYYTEERARFDLIRKVEPKPKLRELWAAFGDGRLLSTSQNTIQTDQYYGEVTIVHFREVPREEE